MSVKILIADDHAFFRNSVREFLAIEKDFIIISEANDGNEAVQMAKEMKPDVIIMDVNMPELDGIKATKQIKSEFPDIKIAAYSVDANKVIVTQMLKAGASAYVLKENFTKELVEAIKSILVNKIFLSARISEDFESI